MIDRMPFPKLHRSRAIAVTLAAVLALTACSTGLLRPEGRRSRHWAMPPTRPPRNCAGSIV